MTAERLAELPEAAATGAIAELYADIRSVLALPMVNLVYRHLATKPGVLEQCWAALRPNLASEAAAAAAAEVVALASPERVAALPRAALRAAGFTGDDAARAHATLGAYRRANSLNVLGMFALIDGCPGGGRASEADAVPLAPILPMAALEHLPPATAALLDEMSLQIVGGGEPRLVPSLLRHFAGNPCLLALLWTALEPAVGDAARRADPIARHARELAHTLPRRVAALPDGSEGEVVETFAGAMARMLVLGEMISAAFVKAA